MHRWTAQSRMGRLAAVTLGIAVVLAPAGAASAQERPPSIYDATALMSLIAPEIAVEGVAAETADIEIQETASSAVITFGANESIEPTLSADVGFYDEAIAPYVESAPVVSPDLTFSATYFTKQRGEADGVTIWETDSTSVAAYVQPMATGVRVLTAIADSSAPTSYAYDLHVPEGSSLRENDLGYTLWSPEGSFLGQIHSPWARDVNGTNVETHYEWDDGTLTQVVDLDSPGIEFPVLMDPAWTYGYSYDISLKSVAQTRNMLHNCFNCYFPVEGAPAAFPSPQQYLPLIVRPFAGAPVMWDFSCYFNFEQYVVFEGYTYFNYSFQASSTHVDGYGSWISFDFGPRDDSQPPAYAGTRMVVNAYIVNDDPVGLGRPAYTFAAYNNWLAFANNIETG